MRAHIVISVLALALAFALGGLTGQLRERSSHKSDAALIACLRNPAYIGVTKEDDRNLLAQCLVDYKDSGIPMKVVQAMDSGYDCWMEINPVKNSTEWLCR